MENEAFSRKLFSQMQDKMFWQEDLKSNFKLRKMSNGLCHYTHKLMSTCQHKSLIL